jgi:hypothetical protein
MNQFVRIVFVILAGAMLWLPYYVWGVGTGNRFLSQGRILISSLIICGTVLLGFIGLHYLQRFVILGRVLSTANFRLLLILSTQLTAVTLIAIDSNFNWRAIIAGLFVIIGAVIGTYALE